MKPVKIDRQKRRLLHAVWPSLIMGPLGSARTQMDWLVRTEKSGLTPGEVKFLEKKMKELYELNEDLHRIYFRLKH